MHFSKHGWNHTHSTCHMQDVEVSKSWSKIKFSFMLNTVLSILCISEYWWPHLLGGRGTALAMLYCEIMSDFYLHSMYLPTFPDNENASMSHDFVLEAKYLFQPLHEYGKMLKVALHQQNNSLCFSTELHERVIKWLNTFFIPLRIFTFFTIKHCQVLSAWDTFWRKCPNEYESMSIQKVFLLL